MTAVELLTVLAIAAILAAVTMARFAPATQTVTDRATASVLSASFLQGRQVASANHYRYDTNAATTVTALNTLAAATSTPATTVTYTTGPGTGRGDGGAVSVSVAVPDPTRLAVATIASTAGATSARCVLAVDSLRQGPTFAVLATTNPAVCTGATAAACYATWDADPAAGTADDPHTLDPANSCIPS